MRAPATFPDEPEPEPVIIRRTVHVRDGLTVTSFDWPLHEATFTFTGTRVVHGPVFLEVEYR